MLSRSEILAVLAGESVLENSVEFGYVAHSASVGDGVANEWIVARKEVRFFLVYLVHPCNEVLELVSLALAQIGVFKAREFSVLELEGRDDEGQVWVEQVRYDVPVDISSVGRLLNTPGLELTEALEDLPLPRLC